jgi:CDP-paratose 2-epimerase
MSARAHSATSAGSRHARPSPTRARRPLRGLRPPRARQTRHALITGGAGFIGTNLAHRLLSAGRPVVLFDNLSRPGVLENVRWLREVHGDRVQLVKGDVADAPALARVVRGAREVYHLAAQVAVTSSLSGPLHDFEVNARGTLNVLEALRAVEVPPAVLFTSTNKVYGGCADIDLVADGDRYQPVDPDVRAFGIGEARPLDFHSPYGCSKGSADQYVLDYARSFGIRAAVFRMSCIYGPHQLGNEDQGWVAHFARALVHGGPITIYGDGKQVRDLLFVEDLIDAFLLAQEHMSNLAGRAFNVGGGPENTAGVLEVLKRLAAMHGAAPDVAFGPWRTGDQRYYVSDIRRLQAATGWYPRVGVEEGLTRLYEWLRESAMTSPLERSGRPARVAARPLP